MIINSIFKSIAGEVNFFQQGRMNTFIRVQGCNLRCSYCDAPDAQRFGLSGGSKSVEEIMEIVRTFKCKHVCITGGEPLLQHGELSQLLITLKKEHFKTYIETNGSIDFNNVPIVMGTADCIVMDYKTSSSGCMEKMIFNNIDFLREKDFIKFVVADENDFHVGVNVMSTIKDRGLCSPSFAFSPVEGIMSGKELYNLMVKNNVDAVLNIQLHKILGLE